MISNQAKITVPEPIHCHSPTQMYLLKCWTRSVVFGLLFAKHVDVTCQLWSKLLISSRFVCFRSFTSACINYSFSSLSKIWITSHVRLHDHMLKTIFICDPSSVFDTFNWVSENLSSCCHNVEFASPPS